jgi:hypothetical protein
VVEPYDNLVTFESMFVGYERALDRFRSAADGNDDVSTFTSVFEVLNWSVALEDRIRKHWAPEGAPLDWAWRERAPGGEVMGGIRFARNSVHHDWSDALEPPRGLTFPMTFPITFADWQWRPADDLPPPGKPPRQDDRDVYVARVEGRSVRTTLDQLSNTFRFLRGVLEPHSLRQPIEIRPNA